MDNEIRESKEYKLAKEWEMAVNSYNFNPETLRGSDSRHATPHYNKAFIGMIRDVYQSDGGRQP